MVENYNGVNDCVRFGKRGEPASNKREEQELGMLCLRIPQSCLGCINTLMIQDILYRLMWPILTVHGAINAGPVPLDTL
ncbi:Tn3 family transposase [Streptosporangium canum]|uniref:Tn3 family transposase n=1 Tax=Streptosporangium canum TaxID=324952 RepID=UPI0033A6E448